MANRRLPMRTVATVEPLLRRWPWASSKILRHMMKQYGMPHEAHERAAVWHYNGLWRRTVVWRGGSYHTSPWPHVDLVEQTLQYRVPADKIPELRAFNSSIVVNRSKGELTVCCANEAMNFVIANLAHDIAIGEKTARAAQQRHIEIVRGLRLRWPEPYAESLQFTPMQATTGTEESGEIMREPFYTY